MHVRNCVALIRAVINFSWPSENLCPLCVCAMRIDLCQKKIVSSLPVHIYEGIVLANLPGIIYANLWDAKIRRTQRAKNQTNQAEIELVNCVAVCVLCGDRNSLIFVELFILPHI